jgi:hypothetical protein
MEAAWGHQFIWEVLHVGVISERRGVWGLGWTGFWHRGSSHFFTTKLQLQNVEREGWDPAHIADVRNDGLIILFIAIRNRSMDW